MANKRITGWCGHIVDLGSIVCNDCRYEANKRISQKSNKQKRKKVNG